MKIFKKSVLAFVAVLMGVCLASCSDANEFVDANTDLPSFGNEHPESLVGTTWERGAGLNKNAYGEDIYGFIASMEFTEEDSVKVVMNDNNGAIKGTFTDETLYETVVDPETGEKTTRVAKYECTYSNVTGKFEVLKKTVDDKGKVSKTAIVTGIAITGKKDIIVAVHYSDTPATSYLIKK